MRKLGLIGGLSWTSTARYYEIINQAIHRAKGGQHSARLLIESLDFAQVSGCITQEDWDCASGHLIGVSSFRRLVSRKRGRELLLRVQLQHFQNLLRPPERPVRLVRAHAFSHRQHV